jgi:hypothetical protein
MRRTGKRKAKSGVHKVEQDRMEENLYKVRKSRKKEEPLREQKREASETL